MKKAALFTLAVVLLGLSMEVNAQSAEDETCLLATGQPKPFVSLPAQLEDARFAEWIAPQEENGVFYFRKKIDLPSVPERFIVHVSADNRYRLFVNGQRVSWGPALGDVENWNYETVDLAKFLKKGSNLIAAQVWNWGSQNGARQQTVQTAFILQGDSPAEQVLNTNRSWKVARDAGYQVLPMSDAQVGGGYIAGGTDSLIGDRHFWGWQQIGFEDSAWPPAREIGKGNHGGLDTWKGTPWKLRARSVPFPEQKKERIAALLAVEGMPLPRNQRAGLPLEIPANSRVSLLFDNEVLTMGFPRLLISGGQGSKIRVQYQESLFGADGKKGNRDEWQGKTMKGYYDVFLPDGGRRWLEPLWLRVFRYVRLTVETGAAPLKIEDFHHLFTAYPLQQQAVFEVQNDTLQQIWEASWRTARLCALDTYMDCPYYEQVQYIGDTRIQALISMYVAGEDRLAKNAIQQFYGSLQPMGLTKSAHPTGGVQIIPPFSLLYIGMIHDYYMLREDPAFIRSLIPGMKFILEWFAGRIEPSGLPGPLPYWNHIDGGTDFVNGSPPGISEGGSAHMAVLLAYALDKAAVLLNAFDYTCDAERYESLSASLKQALRKNCYSPEKGLIAETSARQQFSQHTNIFAILSGVFQPEEQERVAKTLLQDSSLIQTTLYFKFYLFQALKKAGLGDQILPLMSHWTAFLDQGLTTFPEHGLNSRSDCHAWSAHPMYAFLNTVCGIESAAPGFEAVEIRPALGHLPEVKGRMPHPMGEIVVHLKKENSNKRLQVVVQLPEKLRGNLVIEGKSYPLSSGENRYTILLE